MCPTKRAHGTTPSLFSRMSVQESTLMMSSPSVHHKYPVDYRLERINENERHCPWEKTYPKGIAREHFRKWLSSEQQMLKKRIYKLKWSEIKRYTNFEHVRCITDNTNLAPENLEMLLAVSWKTHGKYNMKCF